MLCRAFNQVKRRGFQGGRHRLPPNAIAFRFFSRGLDSEEYISRHTKRLDEEIAIERERQEQFLRSNEAKWQDMNKVQEKIDERINWSDGKKFTQDELDLMESVLGPSMVQDVAMKWASKWNLSEPDILRIKFLLLEACERLKDAVGIDAQEKRKRVLRQSLLDYIDSLPSVDPEQGFPPRGEVMIRHAHQKAEHSMLALGGQNNIISFKMKNTIESPLGPVSSSASYEELSCLETIHLQELHRQGVGAGAFIPRTKLYVTIICESHVSLSGTLTTVVEDDGGRAVLMQVFNTGLSPAASVGVDYPVGSRFCLKNPFLKIGNDGWLLLRVDQPFDLHRIDFPPLSGSILVLGDGDFSYSLALAKKNASRGNAHIIATSFDSLEVVTKTYDSARKNIDRLRNFDRVTVAHKVDATNLPPRMSKETYDSIVWNFPYPADRKGSVPAAICAEMNLTFLRQAKQVLSPNGWIYLTLSQRQGGTTREVAGARLAWDIEEQCYQTDLNLIEVLPFNPEKFEGYKPKRAYVDEPFPYGKVGRTHIIQHRIETEAGDSPSDRSVLSRFASFMIERSGLLERNFAFMRPEIASQLLEVDTERSNVARGLFAASKCFQRALELLHSCNPENFNGTLDESELISLGREVTLELSRVFESREGFLVARFTSSSEIMVARGLVRCFLASLLQPYTSEDYRIEDLNLWLDHSVLFCRWIERAFDSSCEAKMKNTPKYELFQKALFVECYLLRYSGSKSNVKLFADVACNLFPENEHILYHRALFNSDSLSSRWLTFKSAQKSIIRDLEKVQAILQHDETHPLYQSAVYLMAFAYRSSILFPMKNWKMAIKLYGHFISIADPTDRMLPAAHYHAGLLHVLYNSLARGDLRKSQRRARDYYVRGLESEGERLAFFGPVEAQSKVLLSILTMAKEDQIPIHNSSNINNPLSMEQRENLPHHMVPDAKDITLDPRVVLTIEEIQDLVDETGPIRSSDFITACRTKYGRDPSNGMRLRDLLENLSRAEVVFLKKGSSKRSLWILPKKRRRDTSKSIDIKEEMLPSEIKAEDIRDLLLQCDGEMCASHLKRNFQYLHGRPFPRDIKMKVILEKISKQSALFVLDQREPTSLWITLPGDYKASARNFKKKEIAQRICEFLEIEGPKPVGNVVQRYIELFKEHPFPKGKAQSHLLELAELSGLFELLPMSENNKNMMVRVRRRNAD